MDNPLVEHPQLIAPLNNINLNDIRKNRKEYKTVCQKNNKELLCYFDSNENYPIYQLDGYGTKIIYCLNHLKQTVEYYMEYEIQHADFIDTSWITQVLVWRLGSRIFAGLTSDLIFNILLPYYGTIVTDTQQTERGKDLWENLIRHAFDRSLNVYLMDFENREVIQLEKLEDFQDICKQLKPWRDSNFGKSYRFAISEFDFTW